MGGGGGSSFDTKYLVPVLHRNGAWPAPPGVTSERHLEGLCIHFLICCLLSVCNIFTTPTLHTIYYTIHTTHYTLHTTHYILNTTHYTLHTTHYTLHTTHNTLTTP